MGSYEGGGSQMYVMMIQVENVGERLAISTSKDCYVIYGEVIHR